MCRMCVAVCWVCVVMSEVVVSFILPCPAPLICDLLIFCHWPSFEQINFSRKVWIFYNETQFVLEMKTINECFSSCIVFPDST